MLQLIPLTVFSQNGQLEFFTARSSILRENLVGTGPDREVLVYLPPSYASGDRRYPVLYLLHGWGEDHTAWISSPNTQGFNLERSMDSLIASGTLHEMIVVAPDFSGSLGGSWYVNSFSGGMWEDFLTKELVPYVDVLYRTIPEAGSRGIAGHSMGGYGALRMVILHPGIFGSVYAMSSMNLTGDRIALMMYPELRQRVEEQLPVDSMGIFSKLLLSKSVAFLPSKRPPFYCDYLFIMKDGEAVLDSTNFELWSSKFLVNELEASGTDLSLVRIVLDHGSGDPLVSQSREFTARLKTLGWPVTYLEYDGGHTDRFRWRMEKYVLSHFSGFFDR